MRTGQVRFMSRLILVSALLFIIVAIGLITRHIGSILAPALAGASGWAAIPEMSNLPEPSAAEYSGVISQVVFGNPYLWQRAPDRFWEERTAGLRQPDENRLSSILPTDLFGTRTTSQSPIGNPEGDTEDSNILSTILADGTPGGTEDSAVVSHLNTKQRARPEISTERPVDSNDTATRTCSRESVNGTGRTVKTGSRPTRAPIKVQTKIGCIKTILKKAIIEPYRVNGQIEGLRITGLERISLARDLLLESGDIIRAINGQPLDCERRAYEIFKRARKQLAMKIELSRDGESKTLVFYLK